MEKRINGLIQRQKFLREELREAKRVLGLNEDHFISATSTTLQGKTLYEALAQVCSIVLLLFFPQFFCRIKLSWFWGLMAFLRLISGNRVFAVEIFDC